jgi:Tfp pilus assembly protein PilF
MLNPYRLARLLLALLALPLALALLWQSLRLAATPSPLDDLRRSDALFVAGRYHDALGAYRALTERSPRLAPAFARRGMVEALRGEYDAAARSLAIALGLGLRGDERDLARLYQGRVSLGLGLRDEAGQLWAQIGPGSPLLPLRRVLEGESLLRAGDEAAAEASLRAALAAGLPAPWRALAHRRLAALRSAAPDEALAELRLSEQPSPPADERLGIWTAPLLPSGGPDAAALRAALAAEPARRPQLLGQLYLGAGLYGLAAAQFDAAASGPDALAARAYAAYTRWQAGQRGAGRAGLEALVREHPEEPRARALLALAYLAESDTGKARAELSSIRALAPRAPDTHLAWAQWYAAQHDYVAAAESYRRALQDAPLGQRGVYALELSSFYISTELHICDEGLQAVAQTARQLPDSTRAQTNLAAAYLRCGNPAAARDAAAQAMARDPASPEASYYLGRALVALGDRGGAQRAFVSAADLAPASAWRERAEAQLALLGL